MSINVLFKSVYLIDYTSKEIIEKPITDDFNEYVTELVDEISNNPNLQYFKIRRESTEVVSLVLDSTCKIIATEVFREIVPNVVSIAKRLLNKEIIKQDQISKMGRAVKKGSLLQAIMKSKDEDTGEIEYLYMLTKFEHNDYFDEDNYNLKRGFPVKKANLWKSSLFHISIDQDNNLHISDIKIFLDNSATYWHDEFLELDAVRKDEYNTRTLFKSVDKVLHRKIFKESNHDYFIIRNNLIGYMRRTAYLDYGIMLDAVIKNYDCEELSDDTKNSLVIALEKLPQTNTFDRQFNCVNSAIGARIINKSYNLTEDIELIIKNSINNVGNIITAGDESGRKYVKIYTNDEETYKTFR